MKQTDNLQHWSEGILLEIQYFYSGNRIIIFALERNSEIPLHNLLYDPSSSTFGINHFPVLRFTVIYRTPPNSSTKVNLNV